MVAPAAEALKRTALNSTHRASGAKMVDFGGWDMPVQYSGVIDEHNTVRQRVGIFDVSHMGEIEIRGPEALKLVDYVTTNSASKLAAGQAQYSGLLYDHGGFVDDILVGLDPLTVTRETEYAYLAGEDFPRLLAANKVTLT